MIKDTLPLIDEVEENVDSNSGPLDYEAVALTTSPPPLPNKLHLIDSIVNSLMHSASVYIGFNSCTYRAEWLAVSSDLTIWSKSAVKSCRATALTGLPTEM